MGSIEMSEVNQALSTADDFENVVRGYMAYDAETGGLVSKIMGLTNEVKELLLQPTRENIQEALGKAQICRDNCSYYSSDAPDAWRQVNLLIEKLEKL
jgi:hypothetical protein